MVKEVILKLVRNRLNGQINTSLPKKLLGERLSKKKFIKCIIKDI